MGAIRLTVVVENREAVAALERAVGLVVEAADDLAWREDLREAADLLEMAERHLVTRVR
jgi:hypothetical protein